MSAACLLNEESLFLTVDSFPALAALSTLSTGLNDWRNAPDSWSMTVCVN